MIESLCWFIAGAFAVIAVQYGRKVAQEWARMNTLIREAEDWTAEGGLRRW